MEILVTGSAGFIGSALSIKLLAEGHKVIGVDNHNDYYDTDLKEARLSRHLQHPNYQHIRMGIEDRELMSKLFLDNQFDSVINLAAQAGVRYSIKNPSAYIDSNLVGFANVLEGCRHGKVKHLIYASSSSTYGLNTKQPFSTHESVNHPVSLYAATKKANELMAHSYSHLYNLPTTGLRFFTVYGPYDRPDMALQKFAKAIVNNEPIKVFNFGKHKRDFTYIDDIVGGIIKVLEKPSSPNINWDSNNPDPASSSAPYNVYNIGNSDPKDLMDFIDALERHLNKTTDKVLLPMQLGDVEDTYADITDLAHIFDYKPATSIEFGIKKFVAWFKQYYNL
jgi:UDP-glucuronate 4-epimerase